MTIEDRIDQWLNDYPLVDVDEHTLLREAEAELRRLRLAVRAPDIARAYLEAVERVERLEAIHKPCAVYAERVVSKRIAALEEGLRKYGRHAITCEHRRAGHKPSTPCTCGLDALLAGSKP